MSADKPRYWFTSSSAQFAVTDSEGIATLVAPAPAIGRIACVVQCSGREQTYNARHHEQRSEIRDIEQWRITVWPDSN